MVSTGISPGATPLRWSPDLLTRDVTAQRVIDIVNTPMAHARRNPLVTLAYQDLADAMAEVLEPGHANWCSFSQWPSHTVRLLLDRPIPGLGESVDRAFGHGNRGVFNDIGQAYVAFIEEVGPAPREAAAIAEAMAGVRSRITGQMRRPPGRALRAAPGARPPRTPPPPPPPAGLAPHPAPDLLIEGLQCYASSLLAADSSQRAQQIWAGNVLMAAHEQRWLDEALAAGFRIPIRKILHPSLNLKSQRDLRRTVIGPGRRLHLEEQLIHRITRHLVGFSLNGGWVRVSGPLPTSGGTAELAPLDHPGEGLSNQALDPAARSVLQRWPLRTSAECWLSYDQRMGFISRLFRLHQCTPITHPMDAAAAAETLGRGAKVVIAEPAPRRPGHIAVPMAQMDALRQQVDGDADAVVKARMASTRETLGPQTPMADVARAVLREDDGRRSADPFPSLTSDNSFRWRQLVDDGLIDDSTVARARSFYQTNVVAINGTLLFSSLPDSYAAANGVRVLGVGSKLGSTPVRRAGETTNFLLDVFGRDEPLCDASSPGRRAIAGVRAFHALMRHQLEKGDWDAAAIGRPVNNEDLTGTMLTFVVPVFESLARLGVPVTDADREAYTRMWCAVGHLLSVPRPMIVRGEPGEERLLTFDEANDLYDLITYRQRARSLDGVFLLEALLEDVSDNFPRLLRGLPEVLLRAVGDPDVDDVLMTRQRHRPALELLVRGVTTALRVPVVRRSLPRMLESLSRRWLDGFEKEGFGRPYLRPGDPEPPDPDQVQRTAIPSGCLDEVSPPPHPR
jgi:hypothetical protein